MKKNQKRMQYNRDYQKKYVKRYVFKLNTRHDSELIQLLESMDNRSEWFKKKLNEEASHES
ncbi:MAG: hypothetical protein PUA69_05535 [Erysipelotrichaceae bacterium]|nr:hypothetical protein [Erysipelotrichaceae bacterium]